jgi:hypothetical protein
MGNRRQPRHQVEILTQVRYAGSGADTGQPSTLGTMGNRRVWTIIGIAVAAVLGVSGLVVVGFAVIVTIGLSHWASK